MEKVTAKKMRWHKEKNIDDGVIRHPSDSIEWKSLEERYPTFSTELRNVRSGLASDGFQPNGNMKDTLKSRYNLMDLGIRRSLHPIKDGDNILLPVAYYALSSEEKLKLCDFLANLKIFLLSSQGRANDELISLVVHPEPLTNLRDLFNVPEVEREALLNEEVYQQDEFEDVLCVNNQETDINVSLHRDVVEPEIVLRTNDQENEEDIFINDNYIDVSDNEESEEEFLDDNDGEDNDISC
ncbi:hypothetical protein FXO38_03659 [Capsicum annuum]|nr:hypothetical protein FXO37_23804 [Capsicum annuum]KAF3677688.1 hypothetical protein FXO38_03659 [Capsicum annuum]